jgi:Tol biopolymer transport system component
VQANNESIDVRLSDDGRFAAFDCVADDLVAGDTNFADDVFVRDRVAGTTERVSLTAAGGQAKDGARMPALSGDGDVVCFASSSSDLVAGDTNGSFDVFVRVRSAGTTERISVDTAGSEAIGNSLRPATAGDGRFVVFDSTAVLDAADQNAGSDVYLHDRTTGTTRIASVATDGSPAAADCYYASVSADGSLVAFWSSSSKLVPGDTNATADVFVHDFGSGVTSRVSTASAGSQANDYSQRPRISADGRYVVFESVATDLTADDDNNSSDVFVKDLHSDRTRRVSIDSTGVEADGECRLPAISAGGATVAFESLANDLDGADQNGLRDVYVWRRSPTAASATSYGSGFAGELGVPTLTAGAPPAIGTGSSVDASNSSSSWTYGLLLVGFSRLDVTRKSGATVLVLPTLLIPVPLTDSGWTSPLFLPDDSNLCGAVVDLQLIESDAAAVGGWSMTAGLELVVGEAP